jgi:putative membrane protein
MPAKQTLFSRLKQTKMNVVTLILVAAIPAIYTICLTAANQDPLGRLNNISAAIVNLDQPVKHDDKDLALGADLTEELLTNSDPKNFHWRAMDAGAAQDALDQGQIYAVLDIPADFSKNVASLSGGPLSARPAALTISTNDSSNLVVGTVSATVGQALEKSLSQKISKDYLANIYLGFNTAHSAIADASAGAEKLHEGASSAQSGADKLSSGLAELKTHTDQLKTAANDFSSASANISNSANQLSTGADSLASSANDLSAGAENLMTQVDTLCAYLQAAGSPFAAQICTPAGFQGNFAKLKSGIGSLSSHLSDLSAGANQLNSGLADFSFRAQSLPAGADQLSAAADTALAGAKSLKTGLSDLAAGSQELSHRLSDGSAQIPNYSPEAINHLSQTASRPVALSSEKLNPVPTYGYGLAPYFMSFALWIGGISYFLMFPSLNKKALKNRAPVWQITLKSLAPSLIIALAQTLIALAAISLIGIKPANLLPFFAVAAFASLAFVIINQALVALLGGAGRFIALLLVVIQIASAGGMYPVETAPDFFQTIHSWLPVTHAVDALRSLISGGSVGLSTAPLVISIWLACAFLALILAITRARRQPSSADQSIGILQ